MKHYEINSHALLHSDSVSLPEALISERSPSPDAIVYKNMHRLYVRR